MNDEFTGWRKASYSANAANCVEVAAAEQAIGVRDTKLSVHAPGLEFSARAWQDFIAGLK